MAFILLTAVVSAGYLRPSAFTAVQLFVRADLDADAGGKIGIFLPPSFCHSQFGDMGENVVFRAIAFAIGLFGRGRARLGEWPHREIVEAAVDTVREFGGRLHHQSGTPAGELEVFHFRVRGRRMRLCVEDCGDVTLWGPKQLVADISSRVAKKLSS